MIVRCTFFIAFSLFLFLSCGSIRPHSIRSLHNDIEIVNSDLSYTFVKQGNKSIMIQYLGCGGLYVEKNKQSIMIDPFFTNPRMFPLGSSFLFNKTGKKRLRSNKNSVEFGLNAICSNDSVLSNQVMALFSAHSHYDHLLDFPAIYQKLYKKPKVYLNESGYEICLNVIDSTSMTILEGFLNPKGDYSKPITLNLKNNESINVYPILADHNPHFKHIKFFDGDITEPINYFKDPYDKTRSNDWLEGNTFSFLVDFLDSNRNITFRFFVQSSSCNPPAGVPPVELLKLHPVDMAFLGVASYEASPKYPGVLLNALKPQKIVWIHWEDFFRSYMSYPKTVRGTDVQRFFEAELSKEDIAKSILPFPRARLNINY